MTTWAKNIDAITLFVEDLGQRRASTRRSSTCRSSSRTRTRPCSSSATRVINLLAISEAPGLIAPAAVASPEAGSRFQFTVGVDDVDAMCEVLKARGVELLNGPMDRPWGIRTASFRDPGGHIWEIAK